MIKSKFSRINSENYDFLWTVGFPYLYCSMYLESGYTKRDFVAYNHGRLHTLFISKVERVKLSKLGLQLFLNSFDAYECYIKKQYVINKKLITYLLKQDLSKFSNQQLAKGFHQASQLCVQMWSDYFLTEYHSSDLVSRILTEKDTSYNLARLRKNTQRMGKLKLLHRQNLNKTLYASNIFKPYFKEIPKRLGLKWDIENYSYRELIGLLQGKEMTNIPNRSGHVIRGLFSRYKDILGKPAEKIHKQLEHIEVGLKEFSGNIGSKGLYTGTVKIIHFSVDTNFVAEIKAMKKGQVLVSSSTGPEMILACKKAGAIITDEGGIISHAAVISREIGIPSIIDTKIATKVLKDGDMVEVNANVGVVKILK